jgi:hypothetical protein
MAASSSAVDRWAPRRICWSIIMRAPAVPRSCVCIQKRSRKNYCLVADAGETRPRQALAVPGGLRSGSLSSPDYLRKPTDWHRSAWSPFRCRSCVGHWQARLSHSPPRPARRGQTVKPCDRAVVVQFGCGGSEMTYLSGSPLTHRGGMEAYVPSKRFADKSCVEG